MLKQVFGKPRAKLITIIAQAVYRYKSYPTIDEIRHVVQQMYQKWPFLNDGKNFVR